jgi:hypothetical protein
MKSMLKFACPECRVALKAKAKNAGRSYDCPKCEAKVTVPGSLVQVQRPVIVPEIIPTGQQKRPNEGTSPVELTLPKGLGGMKVNVSQGTANTIAKTFLGGLLVVMGAIVMAMFGVKRSA